MLSFPSRLSNGCLRGGGAVLSVSLTFELGAAGVTLVFSDTKGRRRLVSGSGTFLLTLTLAVERVGPSQGVTRTEFIFQFFDLRLEGVANLPASL